MLNRSLRQIKFTVGLHLHFMISDIENIQIKGLCGLKYTIEYVKNHKNIQIEEIRIEGEPCKIFCKNESNCIIKDPELGSQIKIEKSDSFTTVIWSSGLNLAQGIVDVGDWRSLVCVESANSLSDQVTLMPGKNNTHSVIYSVQSLE